jgi:hypothetical protein
VNRPERLKLASLLLRAFAPLREIFFDRVSSSVRVPVSAHPEFVQLDATQHFQHIPGLRLDDARTLT